MKKFLLFSALAAGFLASCSEDELASQMSAVNNNTIAFATNRAKATTRSGETIKSLDHFTVNAISADHTSFFGSEKYTYDSNAGVFKSQTPHYWPTTGTLDFYAISEPGAIHTVANNIPQYDYSNWAAEKDLVAATALAGEKEIPYPLTFKHLTSQIYVSAEAENKEEKLTYKVTSIKMTTPSTGTYSFDETSGGTGTWEIDNSSVSEYSYNSALPLSFTQNGQIELSSLYWNILPVTSGILHFEVQYQVFQNGKLISDNTGDKAKDCIISNPNLQAGRKYIFNFVLSRSTDDEITFTTTISDWDSETMTSMNPTSTDQDPDSDQSSGDQTPDSDQPSENQTPDPLVYSYDAALKTATVVRNNVDKYSGAINVPTTVSKDGDTYNVTGIDQMAFQACSEVTSIAISNSVTNLGYGAFYQCSGLSSIYIPLSVTKIGDLAIFGCTGLTEVTVDEQNTKYDSREGCNAIIETATNKLIGGCRTTVIPNSVETIGSYAFYSYSGTSINIPNSVKNIGLYAFQLSKLTSVIIPNSVTSIAEGAFQLCSSLSSVTIGNSVTTIGQHAFMSCSKLTSVTLPSSLKSIAGTVFSGCSSLKTLTVEATTPPTITSSSIPSTILEIRVPSEAIDVYKTSSGWSDFANKIVAI